MNEETIQGMKTIVLLHSAIGAGADLLPLKLHLDERFKVHVFDFYSTGTQPLAQPFSIENFAQAVLAFIDTLPTEKVSIIGHRMGGYIGLYLSVNYPQKVENLVTIGTKLKWDERTAQVEQEAIDRLIANDKDDQISALKQQHPGGSWKDILLKIKELYAEQGRFTPLKFGDFKKVPLPVLLVLGDRDPRVSFVETNIVYNELVNGQFAVLPNTTQHISSIDTGYLAMIINTFLK